MKPTLRYVAYLLFCSSVTGCLGGVKAKTAPAVYDFGLEPIREVSQADLKMRIDAVTAAESLNTNRIRYRLNYQNPAQVFVYTESRWAGQPPDLLSAKIGAPTANPATCTLQLQLEAFDHVFDSPTSSFGLIQLNAVLKEKKSRIAVANKQFQEKSAASSADAKGGVAALNQAGSTALAKALKWGNEAAAASPDCR